MKSKKIKNRKNRKTKTKKRRGGGVDIMAARKTSFLEDKDPNVQSNMDVAQYGGIYDMISSIPGGIGEGIMSFLNGTASFIGSLLSPG
jgi:hypothetical protein